MELLSVSMAFKVTTVSILIWGVLFPVLVQGLIAYAAIQARGERRENEENRRRREI